VHVFNFAQIRPLSKLWVVWTATPPSFIRLLSSTLGHTISCPVWRS